MWLKLAVKVLCLPRKRTSIEFSCSVKATGTVIVAPGHIDRHLLVQYMLIYTEIYHLVHEEESGPWLWYGYLCRGFKPYLLPESDLSPDGSWHAL